MPEPDRSDYTAARRAAKTLALEQTLVALYVYACQRCGQVQDHEPERCCGVVRSSLAVTRPGRTLPYLALPPTGTSCPAWIGVSVASRAPSPPGWLAVPGVDDLAALAVRRAYERVEAGEAAVCLQDAVAAMRLAWQIERDEAIPARDKALAELAEAQAAVLGLRDAVIRRSRQGEWRALWDEVQKERERVRQIRKTRERFATAARRVH